MASQQESQFSLKRLSDELVDTVERVANVLDSSWALLFDTPKPVTPAQDTFVEQDLDGDEGEEGEDMDGLYGYNPLGDIANNVVQDIMDHQAPQTSIWQQLDAFRHAITWSETFILSIICFQILVFGVSCYACRSSTSMGFRITLMSLIAVVVRTTERLNDYGSQHWKSWGISQNYFDQGGIFVCIMISAPLLVDCLIMLLAFLREASQLLVVVKSAQIKRQRMQQQQTTATKERRSKKDQ
jgi:transmembrane protein 18